jgi:enolase-phosphatase E1
MAAYVRAAAFPDLRLEHDADIREGNNPPTWTSDPLPYIYWLMDQDRKSTALKRIQGEIWSEGYTRGSLHGEVFDDVPEAMHKWHDNGIDIRIFSSGSVLAQKLIFSTTLHGDLTKLLNGFFDTTTGPKNAAESYRKIADAFALPAEEILFISDVTKELDAAREAGLRTLLCLRPGNHPQPAHAHEVVRSFAELRL